MTNKNFSAPSVSLLRCYLSVVCSASITLFITGQQTLADSATWRFDPINSDWTTPENWTPETVPDAETDTASFDVSNVTDITISSYFVIGSVIFNDGASAYTISGILSIAGSGVINNSGVTQTFVFNQQSLGFGNSSTAGANVVYVSNGEPTATYAATVFGGQSNAGSATFINSGDSPGVEAVYMVFRDNSSAFDSTIINHSGDTVGPRVDFLDHATAGDSNFTLEPGSILNFDNSSTSGAATLIADGSTIFFQETSNGQLARVELSNGSVLDTTSHNSAALMSLGSLQGDATSTARISGTLTVGGNGVSTTFAGLITQSGSLLKAGPERLMLTGANTYRGGTTVTGGTLIAQARTGSATGSGAVKVNAGTLAGRGTIAGGVTVGTGNGTGAFFAPGTKGPDTLTSSKALTFKADGRYKCDLSLGQAKADQVGANGVSIEGGSQFILQPKGFQTLTVGTVFTVINNTAATPISGTFANLADGAIITATAGNRLQASYSGGDGNDLTLTVVP
jgi:autotransporter-associated beta strand protein